MIYIVGDSTVSHFNETYYYHRYGWGTQISNYLTEGNKVLNLAMSGRSSLSFLKEENYKTFVNNIKKGDYLFIGFGHNDEKDEDPLRFTSANLDINNPKSFKYVLYNNYIKVCDKVGATPILVTPVVRLDNENKYLGKKIHITENGDYRKAIIELAESLNISYVDLTTYSKKLCIKFGYEKACLTHAITKGKIVNGKLVPDILTVDQTHLNIYGAKICAYYIMKSLKQSNNKIKDIIIDDIYEPNMKDDLIMDTDYIYVPYVEPDFNKYVAQENFKTKTSEYIGTVFGDTSRCTYDNSNGFKALEKEKGVFEVGQFLCNNDKCVSLGKIALNSEGIALISKKVKYNINFKFSCSAKVLEFLEDKEAGFGLSLRDDLYVNMKVSDKSITSNYVACGFATTPSNMAINFKRENSQLVKSNNIINHYYKKGDLIKFELVRVGQIVNVKTIYEGKEYINTYTDFDFFQKDKFNFYICMFATKSTVIEFKDIKFEETGISQGA